MSEVLSWPCGVMLSTAASGKGGGSENNLDERNNLPVGELKAFDIVIDFTLLAAGLNDLDARRKLSA